MRLNVSIESLSAYLKQKKKELSKKGHEERRRATKALRLTATGYQGHERIIDFRLFHPRMIRPVVGGGGRTCLKQILAGVTQNRLKRLK